MNLVDSCGWLEYFADGPNAEFFAVPLNADTDKLIVPTICLYEVFKNVSCNFGREKALESTAVMRQGIIVSLTEELAIDAAVISYENCLPMADSVIWATAIKCNATVWTQDAHFEHFNGVRYCTAKKF